MLAADCAIVFPCQLCAEGGHWCYSQEDISVADFALKVRMRAPPFSLYRTHILFPDRALKVRMRTPSFQFVQDTFFLS